MASSERSFRAVLERGDRGLGWTVVRVPFDPAEAWVQRIRLRVCGEITGPAGTVAFRTSLFPTPGSARGYVVLVNRAMQQGAGVQLGDVAAFTLRADLEERPAEIPEELDPLLDEVEGLRQWYGELSESMRRELGKWICGVKGEDARVRRAEQIAERCLGAMEAEVEFPPLLAQAFRARPKARAGWDRMTVAQRRLGLLAVFGYQSPEARERRVTKLLDEAEGRLR